MVSQEFFAFFKKTLFFKKITPLTRKIKEKTRFWQVKRHPPYFYAYLGFSEIAC
jgi:hypothetical protein